MNPVLPRFEGGQRLVLGCAAVGTLGLGLTALGLTQNTRETLFSYHFAFTYWMGLALGALLLLATFHAARARWPTAVRRPLELGAATLPLFALLFVPVVLDLSPLFPWVHPPADLPPHAREQLLSKAPYLNVPFFLARTVLYFTVWSAVAWLLLHWSTRQDESGDVDLTVRQRRLSAGGLPVLGLTTSFAAVDWLMSLEPRWVSSVFSAYFFIGTWVGALALLVVVAASARGAGLFGALLGPTHFRLLGTLLFAFVCLWAYIAFCQYMLIWVADLPEEVPWVLARTEHWRPVAVVLVLGHFALPFLLLLQRRLKADRRLLAVVALWLLAMHALDTWWRVMPALHPERPTLHWTSLTAFVGVGGIAAAAALWLARGRYTAPVGDPFLLHSLKVKVP